MASDRFYTLNYDEPDILVGIPHRPRRLFPEFLSLSFSAITPAHLQISPAIKIRGIIVTTAFPFTWPRRWALSTGMKLIRWARRPATSTEMRRQRHARRYDARLRAYARDQRIREMRDRDVVRYLSLVRPFI